MNGPRADWVCNSKRCRQPDGAAPVYELPTTAVRCPVCSSKRIVRLYNAVNISSGHAKRVDEIAEGPMLAAQRVRDDTRLAATRYPMVQAVPMRNLGATLQHVYQANGAPPAVAVNQAELTRKAALGGSPHPVIDELQGARVPTDVAARDTQYKVVRKKHADGTVSVDMDKA